MYEKVKLLVSTNPKLVLWVLGVLATALTTMVGMKFTVKAGDPGTNPEIIIVWPDDPPVFDPPPVQRVQDQLTLSNDGLKSLNNGGRFLVGRNLRNHKFFDLLNKLHSNPTVEGKLEFVEGVNAIKMDPTTFTLLVKISIRVLIGSLERISPQTKTTLDDKLLEFLRTLPI